MSESDSQPSTPQAPEMPEAPVPDPVAGPVSEPVPEPIPEPIPDYVARVLAEADRMDFPVHLPPLRRPSRFDPVLITVVRDELAQLPDFLDHHRARGVRAFLVLDNGSTDGSVAWLETQPDVRVTVIDRPFGWEAKHGWITHVLRSLGTAYWYLLLDADERLCFPGEERHGLADLTAQMELLDTWRVRGMLVDLYPPGPVLAPDGPAHTLFDGTGYRRETTGHLQSVRGGPRARALASESFPLEPELTKYPLFRLAHGEVPANPHHYWPYGENFKSPCFLGILHYKFRGALLDKVQRAVREGNYWQGSFEYRAYQAAFAANPELSLVYEGSRPYRSPQDLVDCGLLQPVDWRFARHHRVLRRLRDRWLPTPLWPWRRRTRS